MITTATLIPSMDKELGEAFNTVFATNYMLVIGSLTAYYVGQLSDIKIYHLLRGIFRKAQQRWIQKNISTAISQLIDTTVFTIIVFGIGLGWVSQDGGWALILGAIIGQYIVKLLLSIIDTPLFYLITARK